MSQGDTLLQVFRDRCTRVHTPATAQKYGWCASDVLRLASEHGGREIDLIGLFREPLLLGAILVAAERAGGGSEVSGWTVANRRTAMRSVAGLLAPELEAAGISEPSSVVDEALRACAERVGMRYRLPKAPVRNRGGHAPSPADVRAVMTAMREEPGWAGRRDAILVELMFVTGCRVNAALGLLGASITRRTGGRGLIQVHAKHHRDSGEFLIPAALMRQIDNYVSDFNSWSRARSLGMRVGVGIPGPLWRSHTGRPFRYRPFVARLTAACRRAGVERLTPHAFRHAFASTATESLDRATVARAGGWSSPRLMDAHYMERTMDVAKRKVAEATRRERPADDPEFPAVVPSAPVSLPA